MCDCKFLDIRTNATPQGDSYAYSKDGVCLIKENRLENLKTTIEIDSEYKNLTGQNATGWDCNFGINQNTSCSDCPAYEKA